MVGPQGPGEQWLPLEDPLGVPAPNHIPSGCCVPQVLPLSGHVQLGQLSMELEWSPGGHNAVLTDSGEIHPCKLLGNTVSSPPVLG